MRPYSHFCDIRDYTCHRCQYRRAARLEQSAAEKLLLPRLVAAEELERVVPTSPVVRAFLMPMHHDEYG
jgi:hypothetical protein